MKGVSTVLAQCLDSGHLFERRGGWSTSISSFSFYDLYEKYFIWWDHGETKKSFK